MPADQDASKCYDPTDDEYYYGYGCTIVSTGQTLAVFNRILTCFRPCSGLRKYIIQLYYQYILR